MYEEQMLIYDPENSKRKHKRKHKQDVICFSANFCCLTFIFLLVFMEFLMMGVFVGIAWEIKTELDPILGNRTEIIKLMNRTEVIVDYICNYLKIC